MAKSMPSLPVDQIKAGWATYKLLEMESVRSAREDTFAIVDHVAFTLEVVLSHGHAQAAKSVLHEILHIIDRMWNVGENDPDERRAAAISHGLSTIWCDNPQLFRWIGKGLMHG